MAVNRLPRTADEHPELPTDPDQASVDTSERGRPRPLHLRPALVAWVVLGGAAGTAARIGASALLPRPLELPVPTLVVNVVGALALGALLEALARRGPDVAGRQLVRLGVGTGFLGAFTTYSAFTVDAVLLVSRGHAWSAVAYVVLSLGLGLVAASVGIWAAGVHHRARERKT